MLDFHKLHSPTLKSLFVTEVENLILSGTLNRGDKLPSERELAEKMGVSRIVVNSGLNELARIGFIEIKPRIGAFVADYRETGTVDTLLAILKYNGGILSKKEMKSLLEIRLVFETLALELAIPRIEESDRNLLEEKLQLFLQGETVLALSESIFDFHHAICVISGNTMLPLIFNSFKELALMLWQRYFQLHGSEELKNNTRTLYRNMIEGDSGRAVSTLRDSLRKTIDGIVSIYFE